MTFCPDRVQAITFCFWHPENMVGPSRPRDACNSSSARHPENRGRPNDGGRRKAKAARKVKAGRVRTRWGVLDYGSAMPRTARVAPGGMVFHGLNRGVARMQLFEKAADYQAFEQVLRDTLDQSPMRICAYAVMPNHWHLLLWPECDGELAAFMQRLTITHVRRWQ